MAAAPPASLALSPLPDALDDCSLSRPLSSDTTKIHVSPYGDDTRDGSTLADAVASLDGAQAA